MQYNKLGKQDIYQIVQIFDMDGAYVPKEAIITGNSEAFVYTATNIECKYTQRVEKRNAQKRDKLDYLLSLNDIKGIPYEKYFLSSNLEHALYNVQNLDDEKKRLYAIKFCEKFINKEKAFIPFLENFVVNGVPDNLSASWKYIKKESHSLERHTNLHIYFRNNPF